MPIDRVEVRRVRPDDGAGLIAANMRSRASHAPWVSPFLCPAGFRDWLAAQAAPDAAAFVVIDAASGDPAGVICVSRIALGNFRNACLGWWGLDGFGGRGLMTAGLRAVIADAFRTLGLHRLEANIQPGNNRSIALARRAGFRREGFSPRFLLIDGVWRDHERWALLSV